MNLTSLTPRHILLLLALFAAGLSLSGFVLEHGFGVLPCKMCWWQRYAHYAILAFSVGGLVLPQLRKPAAVAILLAAFTGLTIAVWQFAAQHGWLPFPASCTSAGMPTYAAAGDLLASLQKTKIIPCDRETFTLFGLSLAGWNIPSMLVVMAAAAYTLKPRT